MINIGGAQEIITNHALLNNNRLMVGMMKPYVGNDGKTYVTIYKGGEPNKKSSYSTYALNTNATLRRDEWKQLDEAVLDQSRLRLVGFQDLTDNNLVFNLGNAMGTTVLEWHDLAGEMKAEVTMDALPRSKSDRPNYQFNYLPIPIVHVDYDLNARELSASRNMGNPLDTTLAGQAALGVSEQLEQMLFTNITYSYGEKDSRNLNTIYSYVNHPDRNTVTITAWTASAKTAAGILADITTMKQTSINDRHHGPWMLYIPTAYETILDEDYDTVTPGTTIRERIMKVGGIKGIKVIDYLPANNVLLVQMTSDVVRVVRGMGIQNVEWQTEGPFLTHFKVMTIQVPQIRSDQNNRSGIVHASV